MPCGCSPKTGPDFDPEFEGPSDADLDRFGSETITCPECAGEVYYDAAICPNCGHAIIGVRSGRGGRRGRWKGPLITGAAIIALAAFVLAFVL